MNEGAKGGQGNGKHHVSIAIALNRRIEFSCLACITLSSIFGSLQPEAILPAMKGAQDPQPSPASRKLNHHMIIANQDIFFLDVLSATIFLASLVLGCGN
jgi:hypothetical protein